ncbi:MAG: winged helix-turn-helix domain-containing protein [Candidatus Nitrosocaldus sp.]
MKDKGGKSNTNVLKNSRRSKEEILASVLASAINGATKTKIMYSNALSFVQVKNYINYALNSGFIRVYEDNSTGKRGKYIYVTTEKGLEYLKFYKSLNTTNHDISSKNSGEDDNL